MTTSDNIGTTCLYLPGRGQRNAEGTGAILRGMGWNVRGPDLDLDICSRPFGAQVSTVYEHLRSVLHLHVPLVAKSYGAYLLMHAWTMLLDESPANTFTYNNAAHFFSPVMGSPPVRITGSGITASRLPRNGLLHEVISSGRISGPVHTFLHMGEHDPLMEPAKGFEANTHRAYTLIAGNGRDHSLGREYERTVLMKFVGTPPDTRPWRNEVEK